MSNVIWSDTLNYSDSHKVKWMRGGTDFFKMIVEYLDSAEKNIHFQVYIINSDETGLPVIQSLINASKRGVQVNLVVDDFGSDQIKEEDVNRLEEAGVHFKKFKNAISTGKFYVGRRMHHKVMVVDEKKGMVCGLNIANRYRGTKEDPAWLDYGVFVEGPVCVELAKACQKIMERQFFPSRPKWLRKKASGNSLDASKVWVRMRTNDWLRNKHEITSSYNRAVKLSTKSITIVGGYFLPGRKFRRILADASARNVDIKLILTRYSDVKIVKHASDYLYAWLLRNNIRIFEDNKSMVHGKVAIVDDVWTTVGSYNQNHLSAYLSIELNLDIVNHDFAKNFNEHLFSVMKNECTEITKDYYSQNSSALRKLKWWTSYQLVRFSLRMLFVMNRIFKVND